ncbi:MAG TPA: restriction endonuclease [Blastocatellia bacterium]|nr:restriction endonuclease [Blastocatellia bacterium]
MMRLVFLVCAEEQGLLLLGDPLYDQNYAISTLIAQLEEAAEEQGEEALERRLDAWARLLSTFRAVYGGVERERMKLPAYGGRLFDPDRFPFLEGRAAQTKWRETPANPLPVNNRTVLHLLRSLQYLEMQGEARRLSFRALDIEQIGHVYEGLLDHTAKRAATPVLGLIGPKGDEPENALAELECMREKGDAELIAFLHEQTDKSENTLRRLLDVELDAEQIDRMRSACSNDDALFKRVRPFAAFVRKDSFDRPVVIAQGSVYVTAGTDRRSSGAHYTPRSLTEPIVQYTLEPLVYVGPAEGKPKGEWRLRSPRDLLELKICDMACGSGAFLVQACRYLSERLVEAWEEIEAEQPGAPRITPEGAVATGALDESLIPQETDERMSYAKRIVAQRCLYGVDKNPLAVEMAKLSLWLLTLANDKPFSFLDHSIRSGDSLVGINDLNQLRYFNLTLDGVKQTRFSRSVTTLLENVIALRRKIETIPANTVADVEVKEALLREVEEKTARLQYAADLLISVRFQDVSAKALEDLHCAMAMKANYYIENGTLAEFKEAVRQILHSQPTFHWPLEFPEVFIGREGFDAFVGNPPFMGGRKISGNLGKLYRKYLDEVFLGTRHGNADLIASFLLRAKSLVNESGGLGLLATSAIAEGDTREASLDQIITSRAVIHRASTGLPWNGSANVIYVLVWIREQWKGELILNGTTVSSISSYLKPGILSNSDPFRLKQNELLSYQGVIPLGKGFVIEKERAERLFSIDSKYNHVVFPYITGQDLNAHAERQSHKYIINFFDWPLHRADDPLYKCMNVASDFPECLAILENSVKPERTTKSKEVAAWPWWQYWRSRPEMYAAIANLTHFLAIATQATKYVAFERLTKTFVFSHAIAIIASDDDGIFACVSSSIHDAWARNFASYNLELLRYSPSDLFETFPLPVNLLPARDIGRKYYMARRLIMVSKTTGLTGLYNRFHNPEESSLDIGRLRELRREMDEAVARAYGWAELRLDHDFHETKQGIRFTISEAARREVLDRLLRLNHQRYAEEVAKGLREKGAKKKAATKKSAKGFTTPISS